LSGLIGDGSGHIPKGGTAADGLIRASSIIAIATIPVPKHRAAIIALARGLAEADNSGEPAAEALVEGHPRGMQHERRKKGTKHSCRLDALARLAHNRCG
jgi:hypothetical protein